MANINKDLNYYLFHFKKLKRDKNKRKGDAPHKPILLLAIIEQFEKGMAKDEKIYLTPELVGSFKSYWSILVETSHEENISLPFSHMRSEPFWVLIPNPGCEKWVEAKSQMRSFQNIKTAINYAKIDEELAFLFKEKKNREIITQFLLEEYFPNTWKNLNKNYVDFSKKISDQILKESTEHYQERIRQLNLFGNNEYLEEELFLRSGIFKREILKIYNNTCAVSGMRIDATENISMVDACHIIPFSESYNDTIGNGIALCPNLHRALDRGLISFSEKYEVLVNNNFSETSESIYSIKAFEGKKLLLPNDERLFPTNESMSYHRKKFKFYS